jgi:hypothetical protein
MTKRPGPPAASESVPDRATVAAGFVEGLLSGARSRGLDADGLVIAAGLPASVAKAADARVPIADYVTLYNTVARELGDEGFALFSVPLRRGTFEFLCRAMLGSRDLGEALDRAARFLRVVLPDLRVTVVRDGPHATLEIAEVFKLRPLANDPCRVFAFEWLLRLLHGLASWFATRPVALLAVRFPYARPRHAADYALIYTEHASFGGESLVATLKPPRSTGPCAARAGSSRPSSKARPERSRCSTGATARWPAPCASSSCAPSPRRLRSITPRARSAFPRAPCTAACRRKARAFAR